MWLPVLFLYITLFIDKQYINLQLFNNDIRKVGLAFNGLAITYRMSSLFSCITDTEPHAISVYTSLPHTSSVSTDTQKVRGYRVVPNHSPTCCAQDVRNKCMHTCSSVSCGWETVLRDDNGVSTWLNLCTEAQRGSCEGTV